MRRPHVLATALAVAFFTVFATAVAQVAPPAPYDFTGRTIRFLVGSDAGAGADTESRLIARYIVRYLPGEPSIVVQNIPGAGGARMLEFLSQLDPIAEPTFANISSILPFRARVGDFPGVFDPRTVNWVGGYLRSSQVCVVGTHTGIETLDDLRSQNARFGAQSATGTTAANYAILSRAYGLRIEPVYGYDSVAVMVLAVTRGELDGVCASYSTLPISFQPGIDAGELRLLFYLGAEPRDDIGVPYAYDLPIVAGTADFLAAARAAIGFSRPLAIAPGADPAFIAAIREAFDRMMMDPEFIAEAARFDIELRYRSAADLDRLTAELYAAPDATIEEIKNFLYEN